jgi:hypothetical protein
MGLSQGLLVYVSLFPTEALKHCAGVRVYICVKSRSRSVPNSNLDMYCKSRRVVVEDPDQTSMPKGENNFGITGAAADRMQVDAIGNAKPHQA